MQQKENLSLLELFLKVLNNCLLHFKLCLVIVALPTIAMFVSVMWIIDPVYSAEAIVTPPAEKSPMGAGLGKLLDKGSSLSSFTSILGGGDAAADVVWTFLNSWELHEKAIEKFDFKRIYKFDKKDKYYKADVLKAFRKNFSLEMNDENMYHITFEDKDFRLAAQVVQFILEQADSMYNAYKTSQAKEARWYMNQRLAEIETTIDSLQQVFVKFQKENNIYDPEVQLESSVKYMTTLQADRDAVLIELTYEKQSRGENTKHYEELQKRLNAIDATMAQARQGKLGAVGVLSLKESPNLAATFTRLKSELKMQNTVYIYMREQSEQMAFEEVNTQKNLITLEPPWENDKKVWPLRSIMLAFTVMVSGVIAIMLSCCIEFCKNINPDSVLAAEGNRLQGFFRKTAKK